MLTCTGHTMTLLVIHVMHNPDRGQTIHLANVIPCCNKETNQGHFLTGKPFNAKMSPSCSPLNQNEENRRHLKLINHFPLEAHCTFVNAGSLT